MNVSILALTVAIISVIWNVTSSIMNWRRVKPSVSLRYEEMSIALRKGSKTRSVWIGIVAVNNGGTATTVTELGFQDSRSIKFRTWDALAGEFGSYADQAVVGPDLPAKLDPHCGSKWRLDGAWCLGRFAQNEEEFSAYIRLSTGALIQARFDINEFYAGQIKKVLELRSEKEPEALPESRQDVTK